MYEYLTGVVTFINPYYIVVETNGIGYQIARMCAKERGLEYV